ncbi:hypothetical protein J7K93_05775 [bacterium]|nr:hypothetical protein [bacterium]
MKVDDGDSTLYSYDANDRLLAENEITYTYDDNGNTLTKSSAAVSKPLRMCCAGCFGKEFIK